MLKQVQHDGRGSSFNLKARGETYEEVRFLRVMLICEYMKKLKSLPRFKTESEERNFWSTHNTTDYFDYEQPVNLNLSNLKRSTSHSSIHNLALIRSLNQR